MKETFLRSIYSSGNKEKTLADICRSASVHKFRMFLFEGHVYSTEVVMIRLEKNYASMSEAIIFKLSELI